MDEFYTMCNLDKLDSVKDTIIIFKNMKSLFFKKKSISFLWEDISQRRFTVANQLLAC